MLRRYWLPIFTVFGLVLAAQAQTVGRNDESQISAAQQRAEPKNTTQPAVPLAVQSDIHSIAKSLEAANRKEQSPEEEDRAERDVTAQEYMASWLPWMFGLAFLEIALTTIGVCFVWSTLKANWAAAGEAKRAADAANKTVASMEDTAQRQLRAYIHFTIDKTAIAFSPGQKPVINILYENCGQTPAMRCTSGGELDILPWPSPEPFPEPVFEKHGAIYSLYPNVSAPWHTPVRSRRPFSAQEIREAFDGTTKRLFLFGEIRYFDIFGKEHFTRFRMMSGVEPKTNFLTFCREGNETDDQRG